MSCNALHHNSVPEEKAILFASIAESSNQAQLNTTLGGT